MLRVFDEVCFCRHQNVLPLQHYFMDRFVLRSFRLKCEVLLKWIFNKRIVDRELSRKWSVNTGKNGKCPGLAPFIFLFAQKAVSY